jgi:hypothetical protein
MRRDTAWQCLELMLNAEIVAVNQDPAGHAPRLVRQATNATVVTHTSITHQVFARQLGVRALTQIGAEVAAVLLNRDEAPATLAVSWDELGLPSGARVAVRDVIKGTDVGERTHGFSTVVAKHDVAFVRLRVVGRASASAL